MHFPDPNLQWHINDTINWDKFNRAINGLNSMIAARLNGVPPEAFKATNDDCRIYVFDFINEFWYDKDYFKTCNKSQCVPVIKSGDLSDPNK